MRSRAYLFVLVLTALCTSGTSAQTITFDKGYALVFPKDGIGFAVRSLQIYGDSIVCLSPEIRVLAKTDITKILVRNERPKGSPIGMGAIIGAYAMNYAIGRASNQPGAYLSYSSYSGNSNADAIWTTMLGIALGGGVGYLVDSGPGRSVLTTYTFSGYPEIVKEQWKLFAEETEVNLSAPKFHFTLSGGDVSTPTRNGYMHMLASQGFTEYNYEYFDFAFFNNDITEKSTNFNLLRKAEIEYSVTDNIRAGIAVSWLGEPTLIARKGDNGFGSSTTEIYEFIGRLDGKAYYATGGYHFYPTKKRDIDINAMVGLGMADINHDIEAKYRRNSSDEPTITHTTNAKKYFSAIASGGISYALFPNMTLGLVANYFYGGSATIPKIFIIDLPAMDVTYGTTDIGFSIGMHF